jgi:hypothetical protein
LYTIFMGFFILFSYMPTKYLVMSIIPPQKNKTKQKKNTALFYIHFTFQVYILHMKEMRYLSFCQIWFFLGGVVLYLYFYSISCTVFLILFILEFLQVSVSF